MSIHHSGAMSQLSISEASKDAAKIELRRLLGDVTPLLDDPDVQEVMINNANSIWVERKGVLTRSKIKLAAEDIAQAITVIANINQDNAGYIFNGDLPGLRIAAARSPIAVHGACMSIRKHGIVPLKISDYLDRGAFAPRVTVKRGKNTKPSPAKVAKGHGGVVDLFKWMIANRINFAVSGGTSSGKTTFLNALLGMLSEIDPGRRLFTVEDTRELVVSVKNYVSFISKQVAGVSSRDLVKLALRMRPDSIWFGEVRGSEAYDLLDAYSTGHPGSGVSFHADSAQGSLARLETLIRMSDEGRSLSIEDLRARIAQTFPILIHCGRVNLMRLPMEIVELHGAQDGVYQTTTLFKKELDYV